MENKLTIYNTLSRKKELFEPINPPFVGLYVCGPTVYGDAHLGHARPAITFDLLFRYLKFMGYRVRYVRNITDVGHLVNDADEGEDKIAKKAKLEQLEPMEVVQFYSNRYHKNMEQLNTLSPSIEPHASGHIIEQQELIKQIIENGFAYESEGNIYFDVERYNQKYHYGKLSGRKIDELFANTRELSGQQEKRNPFDFALWKKASPEHIMRWPSPWSDGFPGWHLECSAMSSKYLGNSFDIHGGGSDLIFPHHENECAQSMCAHPDDTFARYWVHAGMLMVDGVKMSKSLGNFYTVNQLIGEYPAEALRLLFIGTHYHQPFNFTFDGLKQAKTVLDKFYNALLKTADIKVDAGVGPDARVMEALCDDLNTPLALSVLHELVNTLNKAESAEERREAKSKLVASAAVLGLLYQDPESWFKQGAGGPLDENEINRLIEERALAKKEKNYARADEIRNQLKSAGIVLEDTPSGTTWKKC